MRQNDDTEKQGKDLTPREKAERLPDSPSKDNFVENFAAFFSQGGGAGLNPEVAKQVTSEHISQILDAQGRLPDLQLQDRRDIRKHRVTLLSIILIFVVVFVALIAYLSDAALTEEVVKALVYLAAGGAGGYGVGKGTTG